MKIAISFDYDSPAGYRESFRNQDARPSADMDGAEALLETLRRYDVPATFGVVGNAALPGDPPEHCSDQIRAIHEAGHEIASHSMQHRFIPPMPDRELFEDARESREVLECCIGEPVVGFIPPFNRPMQFPQRGAVSVSELLGLHGRGHGRQTVGSMLKNLHFAGFMWSRISYSNKLSWALRGIGAAREQAPAQPFLYRQMVAIPLHCGGFGAEARDLVRRYSGTDAMITMYGHPNQAFEDNDENVERLSDFLDHVARLRLGGRVQFCTMRQFAELTVDKFQEAAHGAAIA